MASHFFPPRPRIVDSNGDPVAGGQLFFYEAGTSTKAATYSDNALSSANSNPVVLSAGGEVPSIFLQDIAYKVVFAPADDTDPPASPIWTEDNIRGVPTAAVGDVAGPSSSVDERIVRFDGTGGKTLEDSGFTFAMLAGVVAGGVPANGTDADHDIDFSAGWATDLTGTYGVTWTALTKQADAAFAAGDDQGGLADGVSLPTSGTIHAFVIKNDSTGVGDIMFDTSTSGANVPSGWTVIRRVASFTTDGSDNFNAFAAHEVEGGGVSYWLSTRVDEVSTTSSASETTLTLTGVPTGFIFRAEIECVLAQPSSDGTFNVYQRLTGSNEQLYELIVDSVARTRQYTPTPTTTSAQIAYSISQNSVQSKLTTLGYTDFRRA